MFVKERDLPMMTVEFIERCHVDQYEFLVSEVDQIVSAKLWVLSSGFADLLSNIFGIRINFW